MSIANKARIVLINIGKALPFAICFIIALGYVDICIAMVLDDIVYYGDFAIANAPISYYIGQFFEYDWLVVIVASIISIAIETCVWNRLAILYLALHMLMKDIITFEVEVWQAYIIIIANLIVSSLLTLKGINIGYKNLRCIAR